VKAHLLGRAGEDAACAWYVERGYGVLARNWRCGQGELDLVVRLGQVLAIVEVKARRSDRYGEPADAVGFLKQRRMRRAAAAWLASARRDGLVESGALFDIRFDVVEVRASTRGHLEVVVREGAF
jgi:putative endonuclease